jgi:hypothetical protein
MTFTAITKVTDNYIKIGTKEKIILNSLPIFLSEKKLTFSLTKNISLNESVIRIARLIIDDNSIDLNFKNGFLFINGTLSYHLSYVNNENVVKARLNKISYVNFFDLNPLFSDSPKNISENQLDFTYEYDLNYTTYIINETEIKLLIILSMKIDVYRLQDFSIY